MRRALRRLQELRTSFGPEAAAAKAQILEELGRARLPSPRALLHFHELLCFLRAYPDDALLFARVEALLDGFARRPDLRRHARALAGSGVAGTELRFRFFHPLASWLAARWPERLAIDWKAFANRGKLEALLPFMVSYAETPALDELDFGPRGWLQRLKGPGETDAAFLLRRVAALPLGERLREHLYDQLDPALVLRAGPGTPARTHARLASSELHFQARPLRRGRLDLAAEVHKAAVALRPAGPEEAEALLDLARGAMATRQRDLDAFSHGWKHDVQVADCGEGLSFALIGPQPERRLLLEGTYGFLTLKNGVPIGYGVFSGLFRSAEVANNVFESFRGAEAAHVLSRLLAVARRVFGAEAFVILPYQVGQGNEEALRSGAFWFYQKLGFRPQEGQAAALMAAEEAHLARQPGHRSSLKTLQALAGSPLVFHLGRPRTDLVGLFSLSGVGLAVTSSLAARWGSDREAGVRAASREAAQRLGAAPRTFTSPERLAWERWAPLVTVLPGLDDWSALEKRALVEVIRARGGGAESEYVRLFDAHQRLGRAVRRLAREHAE